MEQIIHEHCKQANMQVNKWTNNTFEIWTLHVYKNEQILELQEYKWIV